MRIIVVELNKYHSETFPIYENLLPSFFHEDDFEWFYFQLPVTRFPRSVSYPNVCPIISKWEYFFVRKLKSHVSSFTRKVQRVIDSTGADAVVFNSVDPERNQRVFEAVQASKKIALIHNPAKFSPREKLANEFYFVLSPMVFDNFKETFPLDGYLLPFFKPCAVTSPKAAGGKTIIGIQGLVSFLRRDYGFLIQLAKRFKEEGRGGVLFNIVGSVNSKDGKKLRDMIRTAGVESYFKLHWQLDDRSFFTEIEQCDMLMPLLGSEHEFYFRDKITSTFSHAVAYNKPMVLSRQNAEAWKLDERTHYIYNDVDGCVDLLQHIKALPEKKERLKQWRKKQIDTNKDLLLALRPLISK